MKLLRHLMQPTPWCMFIKDNGLHFKDTREYYVCVCQKEIL